MSLRANNKLWLISDTHFGHRNIVKFQQRPESHEAIMLSNWIERVREHDQVLHLGDVFLGPKGTWRRWALIMSRLPGEKYLILGNHDKAPLDIYELAGFTVINPFVQDGVAFTHRPITKHWPLEADDLFDLNVHGHVHGNDVTWGFDRSGDELFDRVDYANVSVEVRDLAPVQLGSLVNMTERRRAMTDAVLKLAAAADGPQELAPSTAGQPWLRTHDGRDVGDPEWASRRKPCCGDPGDCHGNDCEPDCKQQEPRSRLTTDRADPRLGYGVDEEEVPQNDAYLVLSDDERAKGFVRPVRESYIHDVCGGETRMNLAIAETYARNPSFYGATYCVHCSKHLPVGAAGEFSWLDGTKVGT